MMKVFRPVSKNLPSQTDENELRHPRSELLYGELLGEYPLTQVLRVSSLIQFLKDHHFIGMRVPCAKFCGQSDSKGLEQLLVFVQIALDIVVLTSSQLQCFHLIFFLISICLEW